MYASRHRSRGLGARARSAAPHPRLHRHVGSAPRTQAPDVARGLPGCRRRRGPSRATLHRRHPVLGGGRDAKRHGLPVPRRRRGHLGGMHDSQPAGHRRVLDAGRDRHVLPYDPLACVERPPRHVQHTLPRRPRACGGEHSGCSLRRARRRSSARSTASASAPAMRRSKRS